MKGSYWVTEKFNFKCSQQEICSKYFIYVGLCRLCTDVRSSRLWISLSCYLWRFLTWISSKLHKERGWEVTERERGNGEERFLGFFKIKNVAMSLKVCLLIFSWHKCTFSPYILAFFHFSPYILILPLLVPEPINVCYFHHFRQSTDGNSWSGSRRN